MKIKITAKTLDEFQACETGAHEDDLRGPSDFTTLEILERSKTHIEINDAREAAQIADCCRYGTFPLHCPRAADRIFDEALTVPGARAIMDQWDRESWEELANLAREALAR